MLRIDAHQNVFSLSSYSSYKLIGDLFNASLIVKLFPTLSTCKIPVVFSVVPTLSMYQWLDDILFTPLAENKRYVLFLKLIIASSFLLCSWHQCAHGCKIGIFNNKSNCSRLLQCGHMIEFAFIASCRQQILWSYSTSIHTLINLLHLPLYSAWVHGTTDAVIDAGLL